MVEKIFPLKGKKELLLSQFKKQVANLEKAYQGADEKEKENYGSELDSATDYLNNFRKATIDFLQDELDDLKAKQKPKKKNLGLKKKGKKKQKLMRKQKRKRKRKSKKLNQMITLLILTILQSHLKKMTILTKVQE